MMNKKPTTYEALEALRVVIKYAETNFELSQDVDLLIHLGRMNERLERRQREKDFMNICMWTGLHKCK